MIDWADMLIKLTRVRGWLVKWRYGFGSRWYRDRKLKHR